MLPEWLEESKLISGSFSGVFIGIVVYDFQNAGRNIFLEVAAIRLLELMMFLLFLLTQFAKNQVAS
jgi:hypothetical protein